MLYILAAILLFGLLIAVHEFGHFAAAKLCGVRVNEFAIGMGPVIFRRQKGDTEYSLRALPIGGFCAMEGETEDSDDPAALNNQSFFKKLVIFAAGASVNFLCGFLILLALYSSATGFYGTDIVALHEDFPQQGEAGLMVGDKLYAINGERVYLRSDVDTILGIIRRDEFGTIELAVLRDGEKLTRTLTLQTYVDENGEEYRAYGFTFGGVEEATFANWVKYSWYNTIDFARLVRLSIMMLLRGDAGMDDLSGPVGIVSTITQLGEETQEEAGVLAALESVLFFGAMIAVNLAVMNLLPLPALDGGRILFLVANTLAFAVFKRKIPDKYENYIHAAGFVLLMALMLFVTLNDVTKLI